jgi:hypothetical protein
MGNSIQIEECKSGYILKGEKNHKVILRNGKWIKGHFIIFIEAKGNEDFVGAMITSSGKFGNKHMDKSHFKRKFDNGEFCKVVYKRSNLVIAKLNKYLSMGPFTLEGELTDSGLEFVKQHIMQLEMMNWEDFLISQNH